MKLNKISLLALLLPMSSYAIDAEQTILAPFMSFIGIVSNLGTLMHLLFILVGMYSMYQLVSVFALKSDNQRADDSKKIPFYFLGAALGLGSLATADVVQSTIFGSKSRSADKFEVNKSFKLEDKHLGR